MGEYVKRLGIGSVKIGTCEDLYYTSYQKMASNVSLMERQEGNAEPNSYLNDNAGFRFRFPWPDEDKLEFGNINGKFNRDLLIGEYNGYQFRLHYQKMVAGQLQIVLSIGYGDVADYNRKFLRITNEVSAWLLADRVRRLDIENADKIAYRIMDGYNLPYHTRQWERLQNRMRGPRYWIDKSIKDVIPL